MMSDTKAIRAAELLRQYCAERGCSECKFRTGYGFCRLQATKNPESWQLDDLREDNADG
ncbi:MAG: hypothetical protein IKN55_09085 [Oscillospiraceae bacterium]|nr:hypothetical protein [Oscillospiraceae bacterium]